MRGGKRTGAGRPKIEGIKSRHIRATEEQWQIIKQLITLIKSLDAKQIEILKEIGAPIHDEENDET